MKGGAHVKKGVVWGGKGHSRSSAMSPFDKAHMTSYSTLIETMHLSCIVLKIVSYSWKFADFNPPHLCLTPQLAVTPVEFR